jgi:hypothetical protein
MVLRFANALEVTTDELLQPGGPRPLRKPSRKVLRRLERIESLPANLAPCTLHLEPSEPCTLHLAP